MFPMFHLGFYHLQIINSFFYCFPRHFTPVPKYLSPYRNKHTFEKPTLHESWAAEMWAGFSRTDVPVAHTAQPRSLSLCCPHSRHLHSSHSCLPSFKSGSLSPHLPLIPSMPCCLEMERNRNTGQCGEWEENKRGEMKRERGPTRHLSSLFRIRFMGMQVSKFYKVCSLIFRLFATLLFMHLLTFDKIKYVQSHTYNKLMLVTAHVDFVFCIFSCSS